MAMLGGVFQAILLVRRERSGNEAAGPLEAAAAGADEAADDARIDCRHFSSSMLRLSSASRSESGARALPGLKPRRPLGLT